MLPLLRHAYTVATVYRSLRSHARIARTYANDDSHISDETDELLMAHTLRSDATGRQKTFRLRRKNEKFLEFSPRSFYVNELHLPQC